MDSDTTIAALVEACGAAARVWLLAAAAGRGRACDEEKGPPLATAPDGLVSTPATFRGSAFLVLAAHFCSPWVWRAVRNDQTRRRDGLVGRAQGEI
ncbi:hypothetical protein E2562_012839 [Oryza meyeriana var. granulata]|uniref:Uncharacterized protein n=1 Tax=Oryza meyeriana var. granulata TaxID=110450 RepID=A0A6G1CPQ2_9ORYZ|nr:hypothetical protein E2562_012839 [Oryza meyeriana var. granulata]